MKQLWIVWALVAALTVGCKRSEMQSDEELAAQGKARVSLSFDVSPSPIVQTKADEKQTADEKRIGDAWVFVFKDNLLKEVHQVGSIAADNKASVVLGKGTGLDLYVLANVTTAVTTKFGTLAIGTATPDDLKAITGDVAEVTSTSLPMYGYVRRDIASNTTDIGITMTRSCARFDAAATGVTDFILGGIVRLLDVPLSSTLYPGTTPVAAVDTTSYSVSSSGAYAYENKISAAADAMHVIVKGTYKGIEGYYKLRVQYDDGSGSTAYTIHHNKIYSFTITKVTAPGFATATEAVANEPQNVSYSVEVTDIDGHDLMVSNGQYYLGLTNSEYVAYSDQDVSGTLATVMHNANASLVTTAGTVTVDAIPSGSLTLTTTSIPVGTTKLDIVGTVKANLTSATIKIRLGNLYQEVKVSRKPSVGSMRSVLTDFSGVEYVVAENTQPATASWLLLGATASSCEAQTRVANPLGGIHVVAEPNTGTLRSSELYVGRSAGGRVKVYLSQSTPYVKVGSIYWATGNLVATGARGAAGLGGCAIGAPTDGGLYFQFGSLIGYKGGSTGTGTGMPSKADGTYWTGGSYTWAGETQVWPTELEDTKTTWTNTTNTDISTLSDCYFNYSMAPWDGTSSTDIGLFASSVSGQGSTTGNLRGGRYANLGVGDPCTYYLGGSWRLPTTNEIIAMCNNQGSGGWLSWATVGGSATTTPISGGNFYSNKLFFPASGYRQGTNGSVTVINTFGGFWGSSIGGAKNGCGLFLGPSNGVITQNNDIRAHGFPVRCVADELRVDRTSAIIPAGGGSVNVNVSVLGSSSWAATASGDGFIVSSTSSMGSGVLTITYGALGSGCRRGKVTVTSGSASVVIDLAQRAPNTPSASDYITIGSLKWAKGNLVADNDCSCRVGAPADGGLYFAFGSLIAYKGGATVNGGTGVGAPAVTLSPHWGGEASWSWDKAVMAWPLELVGKPTTAPGPTTGSHAWYFSSKNITSGSINVMTPANGVGDPCKYYLGGTWRLPSTAEYASIMGSVAPNTPWTDLGVTGRWAEDTETFDGVSGFGGWFGPGLTSTSTPSLSSHLFFPASGSYNPVVGGFSNGDCYYWSGYVFSDLRSYSLHCGPTAVWFPHNNSRYAGFSVRCVSE